MNEKQGMLIMQNQFTPLQAALLSVSFIVRISMGPLLYLHISGEGGALESPFKLFSGHLP